MFLISDDRDIGGDRVALHWSRRAWGRCVWFSLWRCSDPQASHLLSLSCNFELKFVIFQILFPSICIVLHWLSISYSKIQKVNSSDSSSCTMQLSLIQIYYLHAILLVLILLTGITLLKVKLVAALLYVEWLLTVCSWQTGHTNRLPKNDFIRMLEFTPIFWSAGFHVVSCIYFVQHGTGLCICHPFS